MKDSNLCMAVDCIAISDHTCKCMVNVDGEDQVHTIHFCNDHYLRQKALDYHRKEEQ